LTRLARVVLPNGAGRIDYWKRGVGWIEAPKGAFRLDEFMPGACRPPLEKDAAWLGCRLEDFGRHWTEEPGHPWDRTKIVGLIKERAWLLAARTCAPGNA
jgi:hypothetical protein